MSPRRPPAAADPAGTAPHVITPTTEETDMPPSTTTRPAPTDAPTDSTDALPAVPAEELSVEDKRPQPRIPGLGISPDPLLARDLEVEHRPPMFWMVDGTGDVQAAGDSGAYHRLYAAGYRAVDGVPAGAPEGALPATGGVII